MHHAVGHTSSFTAGQRTAYSAGHAADHYIHENVYFSSFSLTSLSSFSCAINSLILNNEITKVLDYYHYILNGLYNKGVQQANAHMSLERLNETRHVEF